MGDQDPERQCHSPRRVVTVAAPRPPLPNPARTSTTPSTSVSKLSRTKPSEVMVYSTYCR